MITVYIDVLFAVNFLINVLIVEGAGCVLGEETKLWRTALSSTLGALVSCVTFFVSMGLWVGIALRALLSCVMVLIAYKIQSKVHFFKVTATFYLSSFVFAGGIIALMCSTDLGSKMGAVYSNGNIYFMLPWKCFFASAIACYALIAILGRVRRRAMSLKASKSEVRIYVKGREIVLKGLLDTGNSLRDPISGDGVIVLEYENLKEVIPKTGNSLFEDIVSAGLKVRMVPFSSLGAKNGLLPAFCPDFVTLDGLASKRCVIGISEERLFKNEDYHALVNPDLIKTERNGRNGY